VEIISKNLSEKKFSNCASIKNFMLLLFLQFFALGLRQHIEGKPENLLFQGQLIHKVTDLKTLESLELSKS
jgi:hypothetical protein